MGMNYPLRILHSQEFNNFFYSFWRCVKVEVQILPNRRMVLEEVSATSVSIYLTQSRIHALQNECSTLISEFQTSSSIHSCVHQTGISLNILQSCAAISAFPQYCTSGCKSHPLPNSPKKGFSTQNVNWSVALLKQRGKNNIWKLSTACLQCCKRSAPALALSLYEPPPDPHPLCPPLKFPLQRRGASFTQWGWKDLYDITCPISLPQGITRSNLRALW